MPGVPPTGAGVRERNTGSVLEALRTKRPASRADLAEQTGLSKPTVGGALRDLEHSGLVRKYGRVTGRRGPSAALYDLVPDAALVLGIDIGAQYLRAVVADLDGEPLEEITEQLAHPDAENVLNRVQAVGRSLSELMGRIELAVVGTPGIVDPATGRIGAAPNIEAWEGVLAERVLSDVLKLPVRVENDVNLAALGERTGGGGRDAESFAYLSIGSGLGAGIVLHGQLHRGARGAAGEIGFLPVGADPFDAGVLGQGGAMEARLSNHALITLAEELADGTSSNLAPPFGLEALFEAARDGDALGRAVVAHAARATAVCIAGLTSVVDLEVVLLGGGIGLNGGDLLLPEVRAATAKLAPAPPAIRRAELGERAVEVGAVAVGLEVARERLVHRAVNTGAMATADAHAASSG
jgi:predicted NBD/HSP70 family sugar kinase